MHENDLKWYYDLSTGEVTQGKATGFKNRMGPYETQAEARNALEIAQGRNEIADTWDETEDD